MSKSDEKLTLSEADQALLERRKFYETCARTGWYVEGEPLAHPAIEAQLMRLILDWESSARGRFLCGERTKDNPMGKRLVEHGAMIHFNHARELRALLARSDAEPAKEQEGVDNISAKPTAMVWGEHDSAMSALRAWLVNADGQRSVGQRAQVTSELLEAVATLRAFESPDAQIVGESRQS